MGGNTFRYGPFEWDVAKAQENLVKHDADFFDAICAFLDDQRVIALDDTHSEMEPRFFALEL